MKKFLLPFIDKSFSFSPKKPFQILCERRVSRRELASSNLHFPNWRCILELARTEFAPRPASRDSEWAGGQNELRSREHSKLPKNLKTNRLEPYFGRAKEIFSSIFNKVELNNNKLTNKHMANKFEGGGSQEKKGYPADFVEKVKAEFPDWNKLHEALDAGSDFVGRYLDDSRGFSMRPEDIVKSLEGGKQDEVLEAAKKADRLNKLYAEWSTLRREQ